VPEPSERSPDLPPNLPAEWGRLAPYGWDHTIASIFEPFSSPGRFPARVTRADRGSALVATPFGSARCSSARGRPRPGSETGLPVTGDWLVAEPAPGRSLVAAAILPRRSAIRRLDPAGARHQVLVANVDIVFVVHGLDCPSDLGLIERALVVSWESGAVPVVVLTKIDLVSGGERGALVAEAAAAAQTAAPGVEVLTVSNSTGSGIPAVLERTSGKTAVIIGKSGVGKSSLANRLLGSERLPTGETRPGDHKGRHTTTARELVLLPTGGALIDTPGLRALGMIDSAEGFTQTFRDVEDHAAACRFRDCEHESEPGCAVRLAVQQGLLDERRLANYRRLLGEIEQEALRSDIRLRREQERETGRRYRLAKKHLPKPDR
jgi:ribosome biogenesis GTPase